MVGGQSDGLADELKAGIDNGGPAAGVVDIELPDGGGAGGLQGLETGPLEKELTSQRGMEVRAGEGKSLRVKGFQLSSELIGEMGSQIDKGASFFDQGQKVAGLVIGWNPGSEAMMLFVEKIGEPGGVTGIIFAPRSLKGLPEAFEGHRIDREELEVLELGKEGQEVAAGLLETERNGGAETKATPYGFDPGQEILGTCRDGLKLCASGAGLQKANVDPGVGAINPDTELIGRTVHGFVGVEVKTHAGPKWRRLYRRVVKTASEKTLRFGPCPIHRSLCSQSFGRHAVHRSGGWEAWKW